MRPLKPLGAVLVQAPIIEDHRYRRVLRKVDFIKRHVFPGSFILSTSAMLGAMGRHSDLALPRLEDIGASYALTLREWRGRAPGYDKSLIRLWRFYLCHCEGGLLECSIGDVQMLFARSGYRSHYHLTADA